MQWAPCAETKRVGSKLLKDQYAEFCAQYACRSVGKTSACLIADMPWKLQAPQCSRIG